MPLKESGEMYLESIYVLCHKMPTVRSIDVTEYMNYSKRSVSRGVGILKKNGYISVDKDGYIYIHDMSARRDTMNCCLFDVGNVLKGGFEMGNRRSRSRHWHRTDSGRCDPPDLFLPEKQQLSPSGQTQMGLPGPEAHLHQRFLRADEQCLHVAGRYAVQYPADEICR